MKLKISGLSEAVHTFDLVLRKKEVDLGAPFIGEPELHLKVDKTSRRILLEATIAVQAAVQCDRCTADFTVALSSGFKNVYLFGSGETNEDEDNVFYLPFEADKIDITREIFDYARLALPMKHICKTECLGLCPVCGVNKNETSCSCKHATGDPRWEILKNLTFDEETN